MKVKAPELFEVIRAVVRQEVKKVLPSLVEKVLSENFVRKIINENVKVQSTRRATSLQEVLETDLEEDVEPAFKPIPKMQDNRIQEAKNRLRSEVMGGVDFFEGTKLIPSEGAAGSQELVSEEVLHNSFDFSRMKELSGVKTPSVTSQSSQGEYDLKMRRLEEQRRQLDVPVSTG